MYYDNEMSGFIPLLHAAPREDRYSPLLVHIVINGWDEPSRAEPSLGPNGWPLRLRVCRRFIARARYVGASYRLSQKDVTRPTRRRNRKPVDGSSLALFLPHLRDPLILSSRSHWTRILSYDMLTVRFIVGRKRAYERYTYVYRRTAYLR